MNSAPAELPVTPAGPSGDTPNRLLLLRELIDRMTELTGPRQLYPTPFPPDPKRTVAQPAELALQAARSAEMIAINVAALGRDDGHDLERAEKIWEETLAQITRIQNLYKLPALPFSAQKLPWLGDHQPGS